jgi:hypothetical protein
MQLPGPVRAVVGLLASAADEAKHLPDRAIELPMLAVSSALQMSLRAQQRYARLAARGDDVINRRTPGAEPPAWATFDDPVSADEVRATLGDSDPARVRAASQFLDELLGTSAPQADAEAQVEAVPDADQPASVIPLPAKKAATAPSGAKKAPTKKAPAKKAATAKKAPVKKTVAKAATKAVVKQVPVKKTVAKEGPAKGKTINPPRHSSPSRFDTVGDE